MITNPPKAGARKYRSADPTCRISPQGISRHCALARPVPYSCAQENLDATRYRVPVEDTTLAITRDADERWIPVMLPADAIVSVAELTGETLVNVLWQDKEVTIFVVDLEARGEIQELAPATAQTRTHIAAGSSN